MVPARRMSKMAHRRAPQGANLKIADTTAPDAPASATILPFPRVLQRSLCITQAERARSAAWAARKALSLGGVWWVETHLTEEGQAWLGLVTPSSRTSGRADVSLAWLIERTVRGVEVTCPRTWKTRVVYCVEEALAFIETAEEMHRTSV